MIDRKDADRFWGKTRLATDCNCRLCAETEDASAKCVVWTGGQNGKGYGRFLFRGSRVYPHRLAYELLVGPIPEGLQLDHRCKVRACLAPHHLEPVTCAENLLRGDTVNALNAAKTHCAAGHEFTRENTYREPPSKAQPNGARRCRTCKRGSEQRREHRRHVARRALTSLP